MCTGNVFLHICKYCNNFDHSIKKCPDVRAIMGLSYQEGSSIKDFIDKEEFSRKYAIVNKAMEFIQRFGPCRGFPYYSGITR